ncbi:hypothetical protein ACFCTO_06440 [Megasphaera indica]
MKKPNTKSGIFLALAILVLAAIGAWFFWDRSPSPAGPAGPSKGAVQEDEASQLVAKMSPEVKIGQLMMIGLAGTTRASASWNTAMPGMLSYSTAIWIHPNRSSI